MSFNGFTLIDKSTGRPITANRYLELYFEITNRHQGLLGSDDELNPYDVDLFMDCNGKLVEVVEYWNSELDYTYVELEPARILESKEVEVRIK